MQKFIDKLFELVPYKPDFTLRDISKSCFVYAGETVSGILFWAGVYFGFTEIF